MRTWWIVVLVIAGCSPGDPQPARTGALKDDPAVGGAGLAVTLGPTARGTWRLVDGATLVLSLGTLRLGTGGEQRLLARQVLGLPAFDRARRRVVFSRRTPKGSTLVALSYGPGGWSEPRILAAGRGDPDRPAVSPEGDWVVFVWAPTGLTSLWCVSFEGGPPVQLTNRGVRVGTGRPGQPPPGFVPVPHQGPAWVDGDLVRWRSRAGEHTAVLP